MYKYTIYPEEEFVVVTFSDVVRNVDVLEYFTKISGDPSFNKEFSGLVNLYDAKLEMSPSDLNMLSVIGKNNSHSKWAILVKDPLNTAFALMYREKVEPSHPIAVVSELETAEEYLELNLQTYIRN